MIEQFRQHDKLPSMLERAIAVNPAVSLIIPVYRAEPYLADCLESLLHQTFAAIEIIVVDDASPEDVAGIVASCCGDDPRIRLIRHATNQGPLAARLSGAAHAMGAFFGFIDSDDCVEERFVDSMLTAAQENQVDLVQCAMVVHQADQVAEVLNRGGIPHRLSGAAIMAELLAGKIFNSLTNKLVRAECFRTAAASLSAGEQQIEFAEDLSCLFRICAHVDAYAHIADPLYHYHPRHDSMPNGDAVSLRRLDALRQVHHALAPILLAVPQPAHLKDRFIEREFVSVARKLGATEPRKDFYHHIFRRTSDNTPECDHASAQQAPISSPSDRLRLCLLHSERDAGAIDQAWADLSGRLCEQGVAEGYSVIHAVADETGVRLITSIDGSINSPQPVPSHLSGATSALTAYVAYEWLQAQDFDIICAPADNGLLFYAISARHQNLALRNSVLCAVAGRPRLLTRHLAEKPPLDIDDLAADEMERRSWALADITVFLDESVEAWAEQNGWAVSGLRSRVKSDAPLGEVPIWPELVRLVRERREARATAPLVKSADKVPLVSVCISHFNRPALLRQAIESIRQQTYSRVEIVVVDDASTAPEVQASLEELAAELRQHGDTLVRHCVNQYLGAARNTAARHARGEFLLFLDDDDYAKPEQIATLVAVAHATGADIVNSFCDRLLGDQPPPPGRPAEERWMMLGNAPSVGVFANYFGPAAALFRRSCFEQLGGFTELHGTGCEDWEIFARATLAGMNLQNVPVALFWYRLSPGSMSQTVNGYAGLFRALTPYFAQVPSALRSVLHFAQGAEARLRELQTSVHHNAIELRQRNTVIADRDTTIARRDEMITHQAALMANQDAALARCNGEITHLAKLNEQYMGQIATMTSELSELHAALQIMLADCGPSPQSAVDAILRSRSWRIGNVPRVMVQRLGGRGFERAPRVASWKQAAVMVRTLQSSPSWELTGPLRVLGRIVRRR